MIKDTLGKHPVSALQELCSKKQWDPPSYEMVSDTGPAHMKCYIYKVNFFAIHVTIMNL